MTVFEMNNIIEDAFKPRLDKYAIYLRKSRADVEAEKLGEGETLARHRKILTELAARKGFYIEKIYEEVVSGDTIDARPEIQKLIQDCYSGKYKGILIVEVTRLSRGNQGDAQKIIDCLKYSNKNNGVLVITPTKIYDVAHSQEDEEYMEFELFMSRREYKMIQKRMDRGKKQAVVEGNYMGSHRPYGYDIVKTRTGRTLIPNEDEAPIVRDIFQWAALENMTPYDIAVRLTAMGVPTYNGDEAWNRRTIYGILDNPTYTGKVRWNNRMTIKTMVNGELKSIKSYTSDTDQYMLYEGKHKKHALVDEKTFKYIQTRIHSDKTNSNNKLVNPLAGLLVCQKCGKSIAYKGYKNTKGKYNSPRYVHVQSVIGCKVKSALYTDVIDAVAHGLKMYIEDFEVKIESLPDFDEHLIERKIELLNKEMAKIKRKLSKLFTAWEDEDINDNEFVERKAVHNARIENIKDEIESLEYSIPERDEYEQTITMLSDALNALKDPNLDADIKNEYVKRIVSKIEYSRENKEEFILDIYLH